MKKLNRIIILALATIMLLAAALPVYADTIIDYVLYTDIKTYINDVEITSYNIKGNTAVVVEDLASYGFDVAWDGTARTLKVVRNSGKAITGAAVTATSGGKVGDKAMPVYATDIKTYLDGKETESYNVGGRTIVYVDDLAKLYASDYKWDPTAKTLKAMLSGSAAAKVETETKTEESTTETPYEAWNFKKVLELREFIHENGELDSTNEEFYYKGVVDEYDNGGKIHFGINAHWNSLIVVAESFLYDADDKLIYDIQVALNYDDDGIKEVHYYDADENKYHFNIDAREVYYSTSSSSMTFSSSTYLDDLKVYKEDGTEASDEVKNAALSALRVLLSDANSVFEYWGLDMTMDDFGFTAHN